MINNMRAGKYLSLAESFINHMMKHPTTNNEYPCISSMIEGDFVLFKRSLKNCGVAYEVNEENKIITLSKGSSKLFKSNDMELKGAQKNCWFIQYNEQDKGSNL